MKRFSAPTALAVCLGLVAVSPAAAHHSPAMYDQAHPITIEGTVKNFEWINPHSTLEVVVAATADAPAKTWTVEMSSPGVMTRAGFTKRTFQPGDHIKLELGPLRTGGPVGAYMKATIASGQVMSWNFKPGERAGLE